MRGIGYFHFFNLLVLLLMISLYYIEVILLSLRRRVWLCWPSH